MQNFTNSMSSCNIPQQKQSNYPFMGGNNTRGSYDYSSHHAAAAAAALHHNQRSSTCQVGYVSSQQQNTNVSSNGMFYN